MILFAGPTISAEDIRDLLPEAEIRPPARTGDIYRAAQDKPVAIGLIDGFFEGVPAVWHKEILWAMDQGIAVFGASSMGALRAAELHAFGMIGVGWIFEAYRDGRFKDDDEVALRHGPKEMSYMALSEPMANIRATLDQSVSEGVLDQAIASNLINRTKAMYFPDRSWDALLTHASEAGMGEAIDQFKTWLNTNKIDQKNRDARDMTMRMAGFKGTTKPGFHFQHTVMWEDLTRHCDSAGPGLAVSLIFDDLRHDFERYQPLRHRAAAHLQAGMDWDVPPEVIDTALTQFRKEHRLYTGAALNAWLTEHQFNIDTLRADIEQGIRLSAIAEEDPASFLTALLQALREEGAFDTLLAAAKPKADALRTAGFDNPTLADTGLTSVALLMWYFETFRKEPVPHDMDLFLQIHDYGTRDAFEEMMARQYLLWQDHGY
ncbi:MAG: TfuA-like protein [Pseudomonadota bacterium]